MKVKIPLMIQDPRMSKVEGMDKLVEGFCPVEEFFLDGPVTKRIAVLDFSPKTGELLPSARFQPPPPKRKLGRYVDSSGKNLSMITEGDDLYSPEFMQVSVFATILKTMYMFEGKKNEDTLGRSLTWAFNAPQLLVVPRAGEWANALYQRASHTLQFFYFPSKKDPQKYVYTCLSRDIVAHETGHAIVDGIDPDLFDACTPQALAIHEAIADLTALFMAIRSHTLTMAVLESNKGSITDSTAFSFIAEEFGAELGLEGRYLRNLHNDKSLDPSDEKNFVGEDEPHALSEVLGGALYSVMEKIHEDLKTVFAKIPKYARRENPLLSASGFALREASKRLKRTVFGGLDFLPVGNVSFADYARAMIAVDQVDYPDDDKVRNWMRSEFLKRHIVHDETELLVDTASGEVIEGFDVPTLCSSDWAAYDFVNKNRRLFCIPIAKKTKELQESQEPVPFQVRPRLEIRKRYDGKKIADRKEIHECVFKVAWDHEEPNPIGSHFPEKRRVTVGTTLVIDWETGRVLARSTSAPPTEYTLKCQGLEGRQRELTKAEYERQRSARDKFLTRLVEQGRLRMSTQAFWPRGKAFTSAVQAEVTGGAMHVRGLGDMLHIGGRAGGK